MHYFEWQIKGKTDKPIQMIRMKYVIVTSLIISESPQSTAVRAGVITTQINPTLSDVSKTAIESDS